MGRVGNAEWEVLVVCKRIYTMTCLFAKDQSVDLKMPPGKINSYSFLESHSHCKYLSVFPQGREYRKIHFDRIRYIPGLNVKLGGQEQNGKESHVLLGNFSIDCV